MLNQKIILACGCDLKRQRALENSARRSLARLKEVSDRDYGQTLGFLAGIRGFARRPDGEDRQALSAPLLIFSGFSREELDAFLSESAGSLPPGCIKAVLTPTNVFWDVRSLFHELLAERGRIG